MTTLGEDRVRVEFNPSGEGVVYDIKRHAAEMIDFIQKLRDMHPQDGEHIRLCSLAQTAFEEGAMWAVKAATTPAKG
jgi:hypothetical protein